MLSCHVAVSNASLLTTYYHTDGRHYSVDWTTGLDYWTHGNCLWRRKEQQSAEL